MNKIKVVVDPNLKYLQEDIEAIPDLKYKRCHLFTRNRNIVELIEIKGEKFVLKTYKRPTYFNRIVYTFFRKTKAQRAYDYAFKLMELGIETPAPVAYIEKRDGTLFSTGYFLSRYIDWPILGDLNKDELDRKELDLLANDFIRFTINMHNKEVLPLDYNLGNIFYRKNEETGHYDFALTDINRMQFGRLPSNREAMRSFCQMGIPVENLYDWLSLYSLAKKNDVDLESSMFMILYYRLRYKFRRMFKRKIKNRLNR